MRDCVREKNTVRSRDERSRHYENRGQYNGKSLGSGYIGGKRNLSASFMFHNFQDSWGMYDVKYITTKEVNHKQNQSNRYGQNRNLGVRDDRRYDEVLSGSKQPVKKEGNGANDKEYDYEDKMNNSGTRVIEVVDENIKFDLMGRSIAGEVKEIEYLEKLS
ncbi:hypothetical protein Tco_1096505 [Tanacetum coccineum]|uniref:Uncharacterized protein n=1 Tax=Tanacetum coccineum TaxID=301880 RepID=A0ABQ4YHY4_9ASTR